MMPEIFLHHVSITCTDLARSVDFYCKVLGLSVLQRPPFKSQGAWLACGPQHVHLNAKALPPFPADKVINPTEPHFAIRCDDFEVILAYLVTAGFRETLPESDPLRMVGNTVEINAAS
jgi:glyoxylase I family protein